MHVWGVNVHDPPAHGKLTRALHHLHAHVAGGAKRLGKRGGIYCGIPVKKEGVRPQAFFGECIGKCGIGGGEDHVKLPLGKLVKHAHAGVLRLVGGGHIVKRKVSRLKKSGAKPRGGGSFHHTHAFLFLREQKECRAAIFFTQVKQQCQHRRICCALTKSARCKRQGLSDKRTRKVVP